MVRGPEGSLRVPRSLFVRQKIRRIAEATGAGDADDVYVSTPEAQRFLRDDLRLTVDGLCELVVRAADDEWDMWTGISNAAPGHMGEKLYYFCPSVKGRRILVKFELTGNNQIRVYSIHNDERPGSMR
jgi:hypothetical protein